VTEYRQQIARIASTFLGVQDHGVFTASLRLDYGDGGAQAAGGYALDDPAPERGGRRIGTARGMEFVARTVRACGVDSWEAVRGRTVFALIDGEGMRGEVRGIQNLPTEPGERFVFADVMDKEALAS
jgi:hypothetical protein